MRLLRPGRELRLEQRGDEESVAGDLHRADFVLRPPRHYLEAGGLEPRLIFGIHFVIAEVLFFKLSGFANIVDARAGLEPHPAAAKKLRRTLGTVRHRARYG